MDLETQDDSSYLSPTHSYYPQVSALVVTARHWWSQHKCIHGGDCNMVEEGQMESAQSSGKSLVHVCTRHHGDLQRVHFQEVPAAQCAPGCHDLSAPIWRALE